MIQIQRKRRGKFLFFIKFFFSSLRKIEINYTHPHKNVYFWPMVHTLVFLLGVEKKLWNEWGFAVFCKRKNKCIEMGKKEFFFLYIVQRHPLPNFLYSISPLPRFITLLTKTHPNTGFLRLLESFFYLSLYMLKPHVVFFIFIIILFFFFGERKYKEWILRIGCLKKNIDCILMVKVWLRWTFVESFETNNNVKVNKKKTTLPY